MFGNVYWSCADFIFLIETNISLSVTFWLYGISYLDFNCCTNLTNHHNWLIKDLFHKQRPNTLYRNAAYWAASYFALHCFAATGSFALPVSLTRASLIFHHINHVFSLDLISQYNANILTSCRYKYYFKTNLTMTSFTCSQSKMYNCLLYVFLKLWIKCISNAQ